jgi:hypothetical protein
LWGNTKQNFIDMGCGNGLLVHILNSEGYNGIGLDVRSRKMWAQYPHSTVLEVIILKYCITHKIQHTISYITHIHILLNLGV